MVDFMCMGKLGVQGGKTESYKMKNSCPYCDSNSRLLILKSNALSIGTFSIFPYVDHAQNCCTDAYSLA